MNLSVLYMKQHDTRTAIKASLKLPNGNPVDLSFATVKFIMTKSGKVVVNREADIIDAVGGQVAFVFQGEETAGTGMMRAEFEVTYPDSTVETFPNSGHILIYIEADLG